MEKMQPKREENRDSGPFMEEEGFADQEGKGHIRLRE